MEHNKSEFINTLWHKLGNWRNAAPFGECLLSRTSKNGEVCYFTANGDFGAREEAAILPKHIAALLVDVLAEIGSEYRFAITWDVSRRGNCTIHRY